MASLQSVEARVQRMDKALKLKDPGGECPVFHVLRKDRFGRYQKLAEVRKDLLGDGSGLLAKLKHNDMWESNGANKFMDEKFEDERIAERTRKRKRKDHFIDIAREERDTIHRRKGLRINNAGVPT